MHSSLKNCITPVNYKVAAETEKLIQARKRNNNSQLYKSHNFEASLNGKLAVASTTKDLH